MPLLLLVIVATVAGAVVALLARRLPATAAVPKPAEGTRAHLRPEALRGAALLLALAVIGLGGMLLAVLTFVVRDVEGGLGVDVAAGEWGQDNASSFTDAVLEAITYFGEPTTVVVMAVVLGVAETIRTRSRWVIPYLAVVVAGNGILTTTIKEFADRLRPELNPIAETLGPSFPSGHSSWAAAFFAAAALLLGRGRSRRTRIVLAGVGAGCAVAIAATRVLLGVHWLSDVLAGLALGWAWFAVCTIAFARRGIF
ncbi:MAG TPA: phosphatase PAP2 family protein [Solirubrobacteraceae bacterium]|jgi:undecaprenyl-diphosphatase|nr:phosphatase PAP2 family protein [Solirubrobacteraceae bacterium]